MTLAAVFEFLKQHPHFKALRIDSRQVQPGDVFLAFAGKVSDGRDFIDQALQNGAAAVIYDLGAEIDDLDPGQGVSRTVNRPGYSLAGMTQDHHSSQEVSQERHPGQGAPPWARRSSRDPGESGDVPFLAIENLKSHIADIAAYFYDHPSHKLKVIGVTGTNGKTSTTHYIAQLLRSHGFACGIMGTLGNGVWPSLTTAQLTTSDCCTIQDQLANLADTAVPFVAMEVSSGGLDQGRLDNTLVNTAVFTNLSQDHLDYHHNMEAYFAAKCKLFTEFALQHAVINLDDEYGERLLRLMASRASAARPGIYTYSLTNPAADVYYYNGTVRTPWGSGEFKTKLIGRFNISNALAALACCALQGIQLQQLLTAAQDLTPVKGRMESVVTDKATAPKVVVDYAHTPDALTKALQALREYKANKLYCIVGCGGDRDRSKRPLMLQTALEFSDVIIITQDNPRTEDPQQIVNDMLQDMQPSNKVVIELDRAKAIQQAISEAGEQDLILIAGKGHEDYQIIGTTKLPFSDQLIAQQALQARR